ncbi:Hemin transport protein [Arenimonas sp. MALMAid1274]|uniref:Hemin transport protein n=1 Tax=Arenimonas sp. MALMAid1274 TaxID=3411630 RepID=UPI003BA36DB4
MVPILSRDPITAPAAPGLSACTPEALSALGPLLCLHDAADPHLLSGWTRAVRVHAAIRLDSDGPCESLHFYDACGQACWRLHLLPDSDCHAWEHLLARLPVHTDGDAAPRTGLFGRKHAAAPRWRACALRLHALPEERSPLRLAATDVRLSPLGRGCAQRLIRQAG